MGGLLPLHHGDGGDVVGGDGDHAGSAPPEFPPLQSAAPVLCFGVSVFRRRSLLENVGGLFL